MSKLATMATLAASAEEEGGVPHHAADDLLDARVRVRSVSRAKVSQQSARSRSTSAWAWSAFSCNNTATPR
ncbi:MAG: hypothetical protein U0797_30855 [Gemmataceae bacterium]